MGHWGITLCRQALGCIACSLQHATAYSTPTKKQTNLISGKLQGSKELGKHWHLKHYLALPPPRPWSLPPQSQRWFVSWWIWGTARCGHSSRWLQLKWGQVPCKGHSENLCIKPTKQSAWIFLKQAMHTRLFCYRNINIYFHQSCECQRSAWWQPSVRGSRGPAITLTFKGISKFVPSQICFYP